MGKRGDDTQDVSRNCDGGVSDGVRYGRIRVTGELDQEVVVDGVWEAGSGLSRGLFG